MKTKTEKINPSEAKTLLAPGGPLSLLLSGYEFRPKQQEMLDHIIQAFNNCHISLIEAGTGIGKSMAYLIPAILWSAQNKERTLISTNTIALQEQLLKKDIPLSSKVAKHPVKAVLVKGMSNYLCLRKLDEAKQEGRFFTEKENEELDMIDEWKAHTRDGSLSDLPIAPSASTWERVSAESDTCTQRKCPHFNACHFFKARQEAENAQLLIVNHAMLFADLSIKGSGDSPDQPGLIPPYTRVILDEAHNIESVATQFFAEKVSNFSLLKWMGKLGGEKQGKLHQLGQKILLACTKNQPQDISSVHSRLTIDIPGLRRDLLQEIQDTFDCLTIFLKSETKKDSSQRETKLRILPQHRQAPFWLEELVPQIRQLISCFSRYIHTIRHLISDILKLDHPKLKEQTESLCHDITAFTNRFEGVCQSLKNIVDPSDEETKVLWIETRAYRSQTNVTLVNADLDISKKLQTSLFQRYPTTLLCSATLTTNKSFSFIRERLGIQQDALEGKKVTEHIYPSPFNYVAQARFFIPKDMPEPQSPRFKNAACEKILASLQASRGNAFVLFTSYGMMNACYETLSEKLKEQRFSLFKQGDQARTTLLEQFKKGGRAVLFGTDSFWEGVDVAGEALRCVIIVKLPFRVPTEPLIEARTEAITKKGGDPFYEYAVPNAIVKFKQGFGRLVRNKNDRGCIVCLDPRIINKAYGQLFLSSLPECQYLTPLNSDELEEKMTGFYKNYFN